MPSRSLSFFLFVSPRNLSVCISAFSIRLLHLSTGKEVTHSKTHHPSSRPTSAPTSQPSFSPTASPTVQPKDATPKNPQSVAANQPVAAPQEVTATTAPAANVPFPVKPFTYHFKSPVDPHAHTVPQAQPSTSNAATTAGAGAKAGGAAGADKDDDYKKGPQTAGGAAAKSGAEATTATATAAGTAVGSVPAGAANGGAASAVPAVQVVASADSSQLDSNTTKLKTKLDNIVIVVRQ